MISYNHHPFWGVEDSPFLRGLKTNSTATEKDLKIQLMFEPNSTASPLRGEKCENLLRPGRSQSFVHSCSWAPSNHCPPSAQPSPPRHPERGRPLRRNPTAQSRRSAWLSREFWEVNLQDMVPIVLSGYPKSQNWIGQEAGSLTLKPLDKGVASHPMGEHIKKPS